jgi:hypothetical protein
MNIYAVGMYIEYELDKPVEFFLTKELARAYLVKQAQNTKELVRMEVYYCVSEYENKVLFTAKAAQKWVLDHREDSATYRVAVLEYWA